MDNIIFLIFFAALCYGGYRFVCWLLSKGFDAFDKGEKSYRRFKIDITENGKNRGELRKEIMNFIMCHGGIERVQINFIKANSENNFNGYATDFVVYDKQNNAFRYNFREHGYDNVHANAGYDIFERIKDEIGCYWHVYYSQGYPTDSSVLERITLFSDVEWDKYCKQKEKAKHPEVNSSYKQV